MCIAYVRLILGLHTYANPLSLPLPLPLCPRHVFCLFGPMAGRRSHLEQFSEARWKDIASLVETRNHVQCLQRWKKVGRMLCMYVHTYV